LLVFGGVACQRQQKIVRYYETSFEAPAELITVAELKLDQMEAYPWWKDLCSEDLNEWMKQIEVSNLNLRQFQARLKAAQAKLNGIEKNNQPMLSGSFGGLRRDGSRESNLSPANSEKWINSIGLNASWELDLWGELNAQRQAEGQAFSALSEDAQNLKLSLRGQLARVYIQMASLVEKMKSIETQIKNEQEALTVIEARFAQGRATALEVLQQREALMARKRELPLAESQYQVWTRQSALLLGRQQTDMIASDLKLPAINNATEFHIKPIQIFQQRPDVKAQWHRLLESDQLYIAAKADRWPNVSIDFSLSASNDALPDLPKSLFSIISADIVAPIFDQQRRANEQTRKEALQEEQILKLKEIALLAIHEVENAYNNVHYLNKVEVELQQELKTSQLAYLEAQHQYLNGQIDYIQVLKQRNGLYTSQKNMIDLNRDRWLQRIELFMSLGWGG